MLKNPYTDLSTHHKVTARVSTHDYHYLKRLFGAHTGLSDKIISSLYKKLVDEIRSYGLDCDNTNHQAWHTEHPNHTLLERIIDRIQFARVGGPIVGQVGARDVGRGVDAIREETRGVEGERADEKGSTRKGKPRRARGKEKGQEKG